jgi:hypothetical protein
MLFHSSIDVARNAQAMSNVLEEKKMELINHNSLFSEHGKGFTRRFADNYH